MKKSFWTVILLVPLSLCLLACGGASAPTTGTGGGGGGGGGGSTNQQIPCDSPVGTVCYSLVVNGVTRTYALHVPANFQKNTGALVIALHGGGGSGLGMEGTSGFSLLADQDGFAVAYPDGLIEPGEGAQDWSYFFNEFSDDVGFIRQLIGQLQSSVGPDPKKVFVSGYSAGAFMSHRLGVELSDLIAGIGSVEGAIESSASPQSVPLPVGPVSVVILHGDQDQTVPYCGSVTDTSQEDTFNYWTSASADSCASFDTQSALCDAQGNITSLTEKHASACSGGTEVQIYKLIGGNHLWNKDPMDDPNQVPYNPAFNSSTGVTTKEILWNFFSAHPKP